MEGNLIHLEKKLMISAKNIIHKKYGNSKRNYYRHKIFDLIYGRTTKFTINYKEIVLYDKNQEYHKRFYKLNETTIKLIKILKYYTNYLTFFCRPIFVQFSYNSILQNYFDIQADIFYKKNYLKKGEDDDDLKNSSNNIEEFDKNIKTLPHKNTNLIFDLNTRKYIDTSTNLLTSIDIDNDSMDNESYIQKMKTGNNKYITIKSNNDNYLFDLIEIIKTKRKEEKKNNKNINININCSLSQVKNNFTKNKKIINQIQNIFNSNKNTIENNNNIFTNYTNNIIKTLTKKKSFGKEIYNRIIFNSHINLSDVKIKFKNIYNNSQKNKNKNQTKKNFNFKGDIKDNKNINVLKKKNIKKIDINLNNIKPGLYSLYKRSSLNIKSNNMKNNNNYSKKTSFFNYKNNSINSIINSHSNIYNRLYNSNSNSPISKNKNLKKENKSEIFNLSKKCKPTKIEKNLFFNISNYLSNKKLIQKKAHQISNNINNNFFNNNNINFSNIYQNQKNKIYIGLYKKTNTNNNSINKKQINKIKHYSKNKSNHELYYKKKFLGKHDKNLLINNLSNYFNFKYLRSKSLLKSKNKIKNNIDIDNLHTFSMRIKKHIKNNSISGYLNLNNHLLYQNFSLNNIDNYNKINNTNYQNNKLKKPYSKKNILKLCNNSFVKLANKINNTSNVKLLYMKQQNNSIDKNGVNLNVNFNLNNINININAPSSNNNKDNNNFNNKIIDKLNLTNNNSNNNIYNQNIKQNNKENTNLNNRNNSSNYKSRNKMQKKMIKKNMDKFMYNLNFNIKNVQNNTKQIDIINNKNKNVYSNYKSNIIINNKLKPNSSFCQSGNKTINLIKKQQNIQNKIKYSKIGNKRMRSFIINKRYKKINSYKQDINVNKCTTIIKKK